MFDEFQEVLDLRRGGHFAFNPLYRVGQFQLGKNQYLVCGFQSGNRLFREAAPLETDQVEPPQLCVAPVPSRSNGVRRNIGTYESAPPTMTWAPMRVN